MIVFLVDIHIVHTALPMMGQPVHSLLLFTTLILGSHGYNLNQDHLGLLVGDGKAESLFGWALQHFNNELYVGAPGEGGTGELYSCTDIDRQPKCQKMSARLMKGSWFGGSLSASEDNLYACAFRHGYARYGDDKVFMGKCFEKNGKTMTDLIDFSGRWSRIGDRIEYYGAYGVSATVSNISGNLVVGSPYTVDLKGYPHIYPGSIGLISSKNKLTRTTDKAPWGTSDTDLSTMKNSFKFAGYSLATGNFFTGNHESYIVGAPKTHNQRGSVYICTNCFNGYTRFRSSDLEVFGLQIGEGFGSAVAACDITEDRRDDLIVKVY